jgi:Tol biopolymer transport system component
MLHLVKLHFWQVLGFIFFLVLLVGVVTFVWPWYRPILNKYNAANVTIKIEEVGQYELDKATLIINNQTFYSDANGKVSLHLEAGKYSATVRDNGYKTLQTTISLNRGDNEMQTLSLTRLPASLYAVKGFVQDYISGLPLANVQVTLGNQTLVTDPNGEYDFEKQPVGEIKLFLSKVGYSDKELSFKLVDADIIVAKVPMLPDGQVVFVSNRSGQRQLYTSAYDGSNQRLFLTNPAKGEDFAPQMSPDNKWILFSSTRNGLTDAYGNPLSQLYLASADGRTVTKIADDVSNKFTDLWSADSRFIYYSGYSSVSMSQATYRVYDTQANKLIDLGPVINNPVFAPRGDLLAYSTVVASPAALTNISASTSSSSSVPNVSANNNIITFNLANGQQKNLVSRPEFILGMVFSADGQNLQYSVSMNGAQHYFSINLTDASQTEINASSYLTKDFVYSPDGQSKAYIDQRDGQSNLYLDNLNGSSEKQLTQMGNLNSQYLPQWDTSGNYLIFATTTQAGLNTIYIVSVNGGDPLKVSDYYVNN